jgi:hypothetical protein
MTRTTARLMVMTVLALATWETVHADGDADLSGTYVGKQADLTVVQGDKALTVEFIGNFPGAGGSPASCECTFQARRADSGRWTLAGDGEGTLERTGDEFRIKGEFEGCCGLGWPGVTQVPAVRARSLRTCTVKVPRAHFHVPAKGLEPERTKTFVVAGDRVEASPGSPNPGFVPALFIGPKSRTAGLLRRSELDCTEAPR